MRLNYCSIFGFLPCSENLLNVCLFFCHPIVVLSCTIVSAIHCQYNTISVLSLALWFKLNENIKIPVWSIRALLLWVER